MSERHLPSLHAFLALFFVGSLAAPVLSTLPSDEPLTIEAFAGNWIRADYVAALDHTHSPRDADQKVFSGYTAFSVAKKPSGYVMQLNFHFHEGDEKTIQELTPMKERNFYALRLDSSQPFNVFEVLRSSAGRVEELRWYDQKGLAGDDMPLQKPPRGLIFVHLSPGASTESLAQHIVDGHYTDGSGKTFDFHDGQARWPETSFTYDVGVDFAGTDCDYIQAQREKGTAGNPKWYKFRWEKDQLLLYDGVWDDNHRDCSKSRMIHRLTRVSP